jgi:hypothetical protein
MNHRRVWMVRLAVLALVVAPAVAVMIQHGLAGESAGKASSLATASPQENRDAASNSTPADRVDAQVPQQAARGGGSTALCKKEPQCSVDSDCDSICGAGLGKCVHSSCPTRICKCR